MRVVLRIRRFNPETDHAPHDEDYTVEAEPTERLLDALIRVKNERDGSLCFRRSCAHGVCGSDAMVVNGVERLACKTLLKDVAATDDAVVRVEPLRHLPVERDLMVSQTVFFDAYRAVKPFLIPDGPDPGTERIQSQAERALFDDATSCILCASCYSSCPIFEKNLRYIGPAAIVNAARFLFDSRDAGLARRLEALDTPDGVWACENHFNCTRVCPRDIKVTKNINLTKKRITAYRQEKA
jgi:succinate dehydrogenase / fumarate reductase iron-sulfur subunit